MSASTNFQDTIVLHTEAAEFFGLPTETTRANLTKSFVKYIHANGLLDADGETIHLNKELLELLDVSSKERVHILNLHGFIRALYKIEVDAPINFQTPVLLSDKLAAFLGLPAGSTLTRPEIIKSIFAYCKAHGLRDGQVINADLALKELLNLHPGDYLCVLNLQRYLRDLYTV